MELPNFRYHPDPIRTGSVVSSDRVCEVCGQARGFIYSGAIYGPNDLETICPWCISDGSAHAKFEAEFVDRASVGGGAWENIPSEIADEVSFRTPGFSGWQQERWFTHCGDAAEFLGAMGKHELEVLGPEAVDAIRLETGYDDGEWNHFYESLDAKYGPGTAYVFKCCHCGQFGGYSDCH